MKLQITTEQEGRIKPFLRWAGGKNWLSKDIQYFLPSNGFKRYHEPFLGGGSIFFTINPKKAYLSDLNSSLINAFEQIKENPNPVIKYLSEFENKEDFYYDIRSKKIKGKYKKAAKFIYLNQTSFNGIYRENLKGEYNVPYGFRKKEFYNKEHLINISNKLKNVKIFCADFEKTLKNVKKDDLIFLDPPYTVTHNHNGFIKYNAKLFNEQSQYRLANFIDQVVEREAFYILTNAAHKKIREIFDKNHSKIFDINRLSLIGGKNAKRGKYSELIISNTK